MAVKSKVKPAVVLAAAAHPDDIEFMMSGTLFLLKRAGCEIHYMNVANGSCGTAVYTHDQIIRLRTAEARNACRRMGATFHLPLVDDLELYYTSELARRCCAVVREVQPNILLLQSPQDYMEDHMNSVRLMVTGAFCRGMRNFLSIPKRAPVANPMAVYHALPYGLHDQLRQPVEPEFFIDVSGVMTDKREMLACHKTQKEWLDVSQGMDSYLNTMSEMCRDVGKLSKKFSFAEGWRRHLHLGFGEPDYDPLAARLGNKLRLNPAYGT